MLFFGFDLFPAQLIQDQSHLALRSTLKNKNEMEPKKRTGEREDETKVVHYLTCGVKEKRYFEISISSLTMTNRYGKVGTNTTNRSSKSFPTKEAIMKHITKTPNEKKKNGFSEYFSASGETSGRQGCR